MSTRALAAPPGFLRLSRARDGLIESNTLSLVAARNGRTGPRISAALEIRGAIFRGRLRLFAWPPDGGRPQEMDGTQFAGVPQPDDGTVLSLALMRGGINIPPDMYLWLLRAELLLEERQFGCWVRDKKPEKQAGRPRRQDALVAARRLKDEGKWNPSLNGPGELHHLLHKPGVLEKAVGRSTTLRIATELGYRSRKASPRDAREPDLLSET